jgi:endoglucanase
MMLLIAYELNGESKYRDAGLESLHYILGRNTFNISFITHVGSKWPMHPHHRPSGADGIEQPWPGLLIGGPNARGREKPATHWRDVEEDASITENAINWQAPLIFVLAAALPD